MNEVKRFAEDKSGPDSTIDAKAGSVRQAIDSMTSALAFRLGMISGALLVTAVGAIVLGALFAVGDTDLFATGTQGATTSGTEEADGGLLPDPFPAVVGSVELRDDDHVRGDRNADLLLIEYSDFECPFCKKFHETATTLLEDGIDGKSVAWVYRHFPLDFHEDAQKAAEASECVNELAGNDGFWKFTDAYFERTKSNGSGIPRSEWAGMAREAGVRDTAAFDACVDSGKYADRVASDTEEGSAFGVTGTPGNLLVDTASGNARLISGAYPADAFGEAAELLSQ